VSRPVFNGAKVYVTEYTFVDWPLIQEYWFDLDGPDITEKSLSRDTSGSGLPEKFSKVKVS